MSNEAQGWEKLQSWFKAALVHCSLLDFEDAIPNNANLLLVPARFFQIDVGTPHRSETEYRSFRLSAASCTNDICFQSTHVPFIPLYWKSLQMSLEIFLLLFIMKKILQLLGNFIKTKKQNTNTTVFCDSNFHLKG